MKKKLILLLALALVIVAMLFLGDSGSTEGNVGDSGLTLIASESSQQDTSASESSQQDASASESSQQDASASESSQQDISASESSQQSVASSESSGAVVSESSQPGSGSVITENSQPGTGSVITESSQPGTGSVITESWSYDTESIAYQFSVPEWSGEPWIEINGNVPDFTDAEKNNKSAFEEYSPLDEYGRCGVAFANICTELMPTEKRGSISEVHPTGWNQAYYPELIVSENLYSRAHLIAFQLAGENANKQNLITGTMYFNSYAMLDFEEQVGDYVRDTNTHVLYRITPDFWDDELVARGIRMEAWSVEDGGRSICFDVYVYNVQPGITIDYSTGKSQVDDAYVSSLENGTEQAGDYVLNTSSMKFHLKNCKTLSDIKASNKEEYCGYRSHLTTLGYVPCKSCNP